MGTEEEAYDSSLCPKTCVIYDNDTPRCTTLCNCEVCTQLLIQNQRRVPSSLYTMNLGAITTRGDNSNAPLQQYSLVNWNQSSDRNRPSISTRYVSTRGSSTKRSKTRLRPGSLAPGGKGVDVKHNSYARYLAGKKAANLKTEQESSSIFEKEPLKGNKIKKYGLLGFNSCITPLTLFPTNSCI